MKLMYVVRTSYGKSLIVTYASEDGERYQVVRDDRDRVSEPKRIIRDGFILNEAASEIHGAVGVWSLSNGVKEYWTPAWDVAAAVVSTLDEFVR